PSSVHGQRSRVTVPGTLLPEHERCSVNTNPERRTTQPELQRLSFLLSMFDLLRSWCSVRVHGPEFGSRSTFAGHRSGNIAPEHERCSVNTNPEQRTTQLELPCLSLTTNPVPASPVPDRAPRRSRAPARIRLSAPADTQSRI